MSYETQNFTYLSRYHLIDNIILLMSKFFIFFDELNLDINENDKKLKFFVVQLIVLLCEKKGLNKTSLNHFFNNTKKTLIFVGIKKRKNYNYLYNLNIYLNKPNLIKNNEKTFFLGYHYFSINFVFKKNIKSGKIFYLNDYDILEKLKTLEYKIDFELYELFLNEISMELNTKKEMLKDVIHKKIYEILNSKNLVLDLLNKNYFLEKKFKPILEELTTIYDDQTFP